MDTESKKVLIVDDDIPLTALLNDYLTNNGYMTSVCHDGKEMLSRINLFQPDIIILDIMLPGDDGLTLCRKVRTFSSVPILMLTARGHEIDRIIGLETGADDYLAKPFSPRELQARIKTILRRTSELNFYEKSNSTSTQNIKSSKIKFNHWVLDLGSYHLIDEQQVITVLSTGEFKLLRLLTEHANRVLSRDQLMEALAGHDAAPTDRTIDVMISRLRRRLNDNAKSPSLIVTVRNEGYKLNCESEPV